ncbi:hypothetical protein ACOBQJ_14080 [Pelotomaculum propionicicum]|uniref:hypothetical protein n=1 Tax=Pelotomaculum propionicicum TaxID=258475 RepID=UPI003B7F8E8F
MLNNSFNHRLQITGNIMLYLLPAIAVAGLAIPLAFGKNNLALLGSYLAVPMFFSPVIYLKFKNIKSQSISVNNIYFLLILIVFVLCLMVSLFLLKAFEVRPLIFFILLSIMSTSLLLEIMLFNLEKKTPVILIQLMALSLLIIWSANLKYYFFIGRTDPITHLWFIQNLIESHHVTSDIFGNYISFPLWHILCSNIYMISGVSVPVQKVMHFTNGLIFSFLVLAVYLISLKIFKDKVLSLLIPLFICLNPDFIIYGMSSIARSVISFFEIVIILLLLISENNIGKRILLLFFTFIVIIYHPVSIPFIFLIFLIIYGLDKFYHTNTKFITKNYLLYILITTLTYWIYNANYILETIVGNILSPDKLGIKTKGIFLMPTSELFNYLQFIPLIFFIIYGYLWSLKANRFNSLTKILFLFALLSITLTFPGPSLLISKLSNNFNLLRFGEYTFFFVSLAAAVGLFGLLSQTGVYGKIAVITAFSCMAFLSVTNDFTASDNPLVKRPFYTYYLSEGEVNSFNHICSTSEGYVFSDFIATKYLFYSKYSERSHILEANTDTKKFLKNIDSDIFLIRKNELEKRPLKLYSNNSDRFFRDPPWAGGANLDYYYNDSAIWESMKNHNKIYESNSTLVLY